MTGRIPHPVLGRGDARLPGEPRGRLVRLEGADEVLYSDAGRASHLEFRFAPVPGPAPAPAAAREVR